MEELILQIKDYVENKKRKRISHYKLTEMIRDFNSNLNTDDVIRIFMKQGFLYTDDGYYHVFPREYHKGIIEKMPNGDYIAIDDEGLSYKLTIEYLNGALPGDVVGFAADKNDYYRVTDIIKRGKPNILCEVIKDGESLKLKPRRINGKLNIYVPQDILKDIGLGNYALFKISEDEVNGLYEGEFVSKAEMTSALDNELSMIAFSNDFHEEFPQKVKDEVLTLPNQVTDKEKESRKNNDLRDDLCFTIDGINTQDMDDAVSAERLSNGNYKVRVYIADVAHYLKNLPATLKEARKRSTSLYLLNTVIHMIPEILSQGLCSLNENEDRLARVITMEIDKNGKVVNSSVEKCIMRSKKKMTYDAVNNILLDNEVPEGYEPYVDSLKLMEEITHILKKKAKDNGRMDIVEDEVSAIYGCDKSILDSSIPDRTIAQEIIACFMIEANATVASYFKDSVLPFIYRIHEGINRHTFRYFLKKLKNIELDEKNADKINNLNQLKKFFASITNPRDKKALSKLITTAFVNAKYSIHNLGHWALSLEAYTHFTSPIRRFPDLLCQLLMDYYEELKNENVQLSREEITELEKKLEAECIYATRKQRLGKNAEAEANRISSIKQAKGMIGYNFLAFVDKIEGRHVKIITENGIKGIVSYDNIFGDIYSFHSGKQTAVGRNTKQRIRVGDPVMVTLLDINDLSGSVYFSIDTVVKEEHKKRAFK